MKHLRSIAALLVVTGCSDDAESIQLSALDGGSLDASPPLTTEVALEAGPKRACQQGVYTGSFEGLYHPAVFGFGGGLIEVTISARAEPPGVSFSLVPSQQPHILTIEHGCFYADTGGAHLSPGKLVARLTGQLDCSTGQLDAQLRGLWTVPDIPGLQLPLIGSAARIGPVSAMFADGRWSVEEEPLPENLRNTNFYGLGEGTWSADLNPDASVPTRCHGLLFDGGVHYFEGAR